MGGDYRKEFFDFEGVAYLNSANQGPMLRVSAKAAQAGMEWKKLPHTLPEDMYFDLPDRIREKTARMIGANADEIAVTTGASAGMCHVAAGMNFQSGDEVIVAQREFPAHFATWLPYERAGVLRVKVISPRGKFTTAEDYIEQIGPRTRLVSASLVRFDNGVRLDAARLAEKCHAAGALLLLDITQAAGAIPASIRETGADFAVGSGYKWLLGPYGTGYFWVKRERIEQLSLGAAYWMAVEGSRKFDTLPMEGMRLTPGARRWDTAETASFTQLMAWDAALDFLLQIGIDAISQHREELVQEVVERLPRDRCGLVSPLEKERRGPFVCISARKAEENRALYQKLREAGVIVSLREGALRIAPFLHNTSEDVNKLVKVLSVV
ncbi:MAG TPA: aminotransferase class V-fold PLP-dependent enzyme [Candidatus Acidoferrum sp.]|nr:aminotransferase class V-fold PLP-dependent enzyme [Candidatus Acidoferrum sp.]